VSDAEWYFQQKIKLMQEMSLFALIFLQQSIEDPIAKYQRQWQEKGIPSNKAVLKRVER